MTATTAEPISAALARALTAAAADPSVFATRERGAYVHGRAGGSTGKSTAKRHQVWRDLRGAGFSVKDIAAATSSKPSTIRMALLTKRSPNHMPTTETPTETAQTPPPARGPTKPDRFDDLFNWNHARILKAAMDARPERLNIRPMLKRNRLAMGFIDRLLAAGDLIAFDSDEDPNGHMVEITKAGERHYNKWIRENGADPGASATDPIYAHAALSSSRQSVGLPGEPAIPNGRQGRKPPTRRKAAHAEPSPPPSTEGPGMDLGDDD